MDYHIIRSGRRTLAMQVTPDAEIIIRAPYRAGQAEIDRFIDDNQAWLRKHLAMAEEKKKARAESPYGEITPEQVKKLAALASETIPPRVERYAEQMGVTYGRITIRCQKSRWGSCSSRGNLNFNCLLMLTPPEVQDYVIVHELAHRKQMNHSMDFWAEVGKVLPDYRTREKWLKKNGTDIICAVAAYAS